MPVRPIWCDDRLARVPRRPGRKIHLDFHNSQHVPDVASAFDAEQFADQLTRAHVNAIVVFAKDMHGYFYYPSGYGPVHPGLARDLLGEQVEACRRAGIAVSGYYCVTWDNHLAEQHPEWLVFKRDRTTYLPRFDETPGWTALCLANQDFVDLVLAHSQELLTRYPLDGIWYDMPLPIGGECYCSRCLAAIRSGGGDPFDTGTQRWHKQRLMTDFLRRSQQLAHRLRPGCQVDQNNQTSLGLGERAGWLDNIDIEALPTGGWGYAYFPVNVRYARTFGVSVYGQTGRFHRAWADFGGLKHPHQLRAELGSIVAQGARCCIGDQPPPSGRLDPAVYETIGGCYAALAALEPFLDGAVPAVEAALLIDGWPLTDPGGWHSPPTGGRDDRLTDAVAGTAKLLAELHVQFDVVDPVADLERYRLVVVADSVRVPPELAQRLRGYVAAGGAVIASHDALREDDRDRSWVDGAGLTYAGQSRFVPAYLVPEPGELERIPRFEYALYDGTAQWTVAPDTDIRLLARVGEPLFQRGPQHYTSHAQTPFDHVTGYAAVAVRGRVGMVSFPVGTSYHRHGYWVYRELFRHLVDAVLPDRLVRTTAPISTDVAVTYQAAQADRPRRWLVHLVNWSANRRAPGHIETHEDPVPLSDVVVELGVPTALTRAYAAPDRAPLALERGGPPRPEGGGSTGWRIEVPRIDIHTVVVCE